jgi:hypothetical protein
MIQQSEQELFDDVSSLLTLSQHRGRRDLHFSELLDDLGKRWGTVTGKRQVTSGLVVHFRNLSASPFL